MVPSLLFLLLSAILFKNSKANDVEMEPDLKSRLDALQKTNHQGPIRAYIGDRLPKDLNIICENVPGKKGSRNRRCRLENICFNLKSLHLECSAHVTVQNINFPKDGIELTSIEEGYIYPFSPNVFETSNEGEEPGKGSVMYVDNPTLLFKQFYNSNIMHVLHDDILPLLFTIAGTAELAETEEFEDEVRMIVSLEGGSPPLFNGDLYNLLGQHHRIDHMPSALGDLGKQLKYVCFNNAFVGLSSSTTWYQYGYSRPQGPFPGLNRTFVGENVRAGIDWLKTRLNLSNEPHSLNSSTRYISVISRTRTRLILNENDLLQQLQKAFPHSKVRFIREEELKIVEIMRIIGESSVLIGMHGALLALSAFLPSGALLVEMFPFGIPVENYTPYRTLAQLPKMDIKYRVWVNDHEDAPYNIGHPNTHPYLGGISFLPASYQSGILAIKTVPLHKCCQSPFWLYRIFQDTRVDTDKIIEIIREEAVV